MLKGSCCCGSVTFEVSKAPEIMGTCHCSRCRKLGASTLVMVSKDAFRITNGREFITEFEATPPFKFDRCFCSKCGTALGEVLSDENMFPVVANCFDTPLELNVQFHEWVSAKPSWHVIGDEAKQFEGDPH